MPHFVMLKIMRGSVMLSGSDEATTRIAANLISQQSFQFQGKIEYLALEPDKDCPQVCAPVTAANCHCSREATPPRSLM